MEVGEEVEFDMDGVKKSYRIDAQIEASPNGVTQGAFSHQLDFVRPRRAAVLRGQDRG
jgi:hypothetical protein